MSRYFIPYGTVCTACTAKITRCKFQDSVFLRLTVRCDTVRYGNLLQYYNTVYTTGYTEDLRT
jgi:hypothetical protein